MVAEVSHELSTVRFDAMASLVNARVDNPADAGVDRYVGLEHLDSDSLRIRRWGHVSDVTSTKLRFEPGDIIFGRRRVYLRKLAVADFDGICSAHAMVLRANPDVVLPEFLPFVMQSDSFMRRAVEISVGSLSPTINWKTLAREHIRLPPLPVQERLAEAMTIASEFVISMEQVADAAHALERSLGEKLFSSIVVESGQPLAEAVFEDLQRIDIEPSESYRTVGVLNSGEGLFEKDDLLGSDTSYKKMNVLRKNQMVMRKLTAWEGAIAVVPPEYEGAVVSSEFPTMTLRSEVILPEFATWLVRQPRFWTEMKARSRGTALRRSRLHQRDLLSIPVNLPSLVEQQEIAASLSAVRRACELARERAAQAQNCLRTMRESLLGEVGVGLSVRNRVEHE